MYEKESIQNCYQRILHIFILACQPEPNWPAIVTLMLSHDMKMSKVILLNFGAFVPGRGIDR